MRRLSSRVARGLTSDQPREGLRSRMSRIGKRFLVQVYGKEGAEQITSRRVTLLSFIAPIMGAAADFGAVFGNATEWLLATSSAFFIILILPALFKWKHCERCALPCVVAFVFALVFGFFYVGQQISDQFVPDESHRGVLKNINAIKNLQEDMVSNLSAKIQSVEKRILNLPEEMMPVLNRHAQQLEVQRLIKEQIQKSERLSNIFSEAAWSRSAPDISRILESSPSIDRHDNETYTYEYDAKGMQMALRTDRMGRIEEVVATLNALPVPSKEGEQNIITKLESSDIAVEESSPSIEVEIKLPNFAYLVSWFNRIPQHKDMKGFLGAFETANAAGPKIWGKATIGDVLGDGADADFRKGSCKLYINVANGTCATGFGVLCEKSEPEPGYYSGSFVLEENSCSEPPKFGQANKDAEDYFKSNGPKNPKDTNIFFAGMSTSSSEKFWMSKVGREWQANLYNKFYKNILISRITLTEPKIFQNSNIKKQ
ncbi:hypothetical protein [Methylobacterium aquaticum]|uniref:hypothetical protein n=1 Tax=Methylobacterium aquaticum TaxID=270351 RepID=UPI000A876DF5|nr:hypothetical protein [Methylobacterium aquaticum]